MKRFVAAAVFASACLGAGRPDFTGTWTLNVASSDFGRLSPPQSMVSRVEHKDPELRVSTTVTTLQGPYSNSYSYRTDGVEQTNTVRGGVTTSKARWVEQELVVDVYVRSSSGEMIFTDVWRLPADRKTLTVVRTLRGPRGDQKQKFVYDRDGQ
jgi:hypothetical protein